MELNKETRKADPRLKFKVQRVIVSFSFLIFFGKLIAYFLTNSVGVLTDALESTVNVTTGLISLYSLYITLKPRDKNHPFGHGKAEFLSASVEGFLIILAGLIILFEAVKRLFTLAEVSQLDIGIIIIAAAGLLNYVIGMYSIRVGKRNNSIALVSGGKHLQSDTYSSIGLVVGLLLLNYTGLAWIDSAIALIFGTIIIVTGVKILMETTSNLMDEADFERIEVLSVIFETNRKKDWIDIHNLKLVKYGDTNHLSCDLVLPFYYSISKAHEEGEVLKTTITQGFPEDVMLTLHIDGCAPSYCINCEIDNCAERKSQFRSRVRWELSTLIREEKS